MTPTFTPGPWRVWVGADHMARVRASGATVAPDCVALVTGGVDEGDELYGGPVYAANANLIAAAPDLFAQLAACVESIERMAERLEAEHPTAMALWRNRAEAGRSALTKARGESR